MAKKNKNLKGEDGEDLKKKLEALREEVRVLKFKMEGAKSKNVKELSVLRKDIARILTELNRNSKKN